MAVVKVISIGKTTTYIHDDGSTTVYSGGTSSWRNNNPGNVNGGPGMLGKDAGGNAIFPDLATGEQARRKLFEPGGSYYDKSSILDAMHTYLPHDDGVNPRLKGNNPDQYTKELKMIAQKNGFDNLDVYNKPIAQLTLEELNAFLEAKKIREGWKVGNIEQFDSSGHPVGPYLPGPNGENLVQPSSSRRGDSDVDCLPDMMNTCRNLFNTATVTPSPIILDLDGDGVETTNFKDGAYFDHDG
ncbi:MAG: hypothetical protein NTX75_02505, partial [Proteobacteria bacterium]|nr:hypothetical protein [Pseudomonadota bacterium]